jgi:hypothetical protein
MLDDLKASVKSAILSSHSTQTQQLKRCSNYLRTRRKENFRLSRKMEIRK